MTWCVRECDQVRSQLRRQLHSCGFASDAPEGAAGVREGGAGQDDGGGAAAAATAEELPLLRAVICSGLYPNVARATRTRAKGAGHAAYERLLLETPAESRVLQA